MPEGFRGVIFFAALVLINFVFSSFPNSLQPSIRGGGPSAVSLAPANVNSRWVGGYLALIAVDDTQSGWTHHPTEMGISAGIYLRVFC